MRETRITVAPLYFSQEQEANLQTALVNAFVQQRRHPFTLIFKKPLRQADILIIKSDETRPRTIGEVMQRIYSAKAVVFVTSSAKVSDSAEYEYSLGWDELGERLLPVLEAAHEQRDIDGHPARDETPAEPTDDIPVETGKLRILVADDSPTARDQLRLFLENKGHDCYTVNDGETAVQQAEQHDYDLIFLDVMMPGMNGYAACKEIKATERYKQKPVVMLTSRKSTTDRVHGLMAGCTRYLVKPVRAGDLDDLLTTLFRPRRPSPATDSVHHTAG